MLFSSFSVKNLTLKNRIVMPPMCMYCANLDGTVTDWHVIHYATRAVGQVGLLIVESTAVAPEGRLTDSDLGLWDDRQVDGLKRLVEAVLANGSRIGIQLNHVKHKGIDVVDVSSGAVTETVPRAYPGYQIPFALTIRERTNLPVIGGGLITEPMQALRVVKSGVDLVYIGRELLRNPYWPLKAAYLLGQNIEWPAQYIRGKFPTQLHEN